MKALFPSLSLLALLGFFLTPQVARAQDMPPAPLQGEAPPPPDQGAAPPPPYGAGPQDQSAPPPPPPYEAGPQDQGAPQDDQGASFQTFYDQLGSQGNWVQTDNYGYVFQPNVSDPNWAPYTQGHWVYTDAGWTWASDEPWGWATYHYGRWANIEGAGWVWVPGYRWAPAWVSWRYGGGYAGWAPLPPETMVGAEYDGPGAGVWASFHFGGDVDVSFNIGAGCYSFVRVGDLCQPNYHDRYIPRYNNYTVINQTTNITNINIDRAGAPYGHPDRRFRGVSVGGPSLNTVNAQSPHHFQTVHLAEANQPGLGRVEGNSFPVYAPHMNPNTLHEARPPTVAQTINHPTFNRGDSITQPLAVNAHLAPPPPTPMAIQQAQEAQQHAPEHAKIATEQTPIRTPLSQPITSLAPVSHAPMALAPSSQVHPNYGNPSVPHNPTSAPFTGETVKPHVTQPTEPTQVYHQPSVNPGAQHEAAPFTGNSTTPNAAQEQARQQAELQEREAQAHQQAQQQQVHQQQAELQAREAQIHQQAEQQEIHQQQQQVPQQYHQAQPSQVHEQQAPQFHQQQEAPSHASPPPPPVHATAPAPQSHPAPAPAQHPSGGNSGNSGNGNNNDKNKPQGQ